MQMRSQAQVRMGVKPPPCLQGGRISTPFGALTILVDASGRLTRLAFPEEVQSHRWRVDAGSIHWEQSAVMPVAAQIDAYFAGTRREFDLELAPGGTAFQQSVWDALRHIPFGTTLTYGQFAAQLGFPKAARAIGAANGANPISLIIPCHRLIGSSGSLVDYAGGLAVKRGLLIFEGALSEAARSKVAGPAGT
jgi:methylated-DNA-[protein]-cysteine S-methyltransferase